MPHQGPGWRARRPCSVPDLLPIRTASSRHPQVYGATFIAWLEGRNKYVTWARLLLRRGRHKYKENELNADKITSWSHHLNYEAVVQYGGERLQPRPGFPASSVFSVARRRGASWLSALGLSHSQTLSFSQALQQGCNRCPLAEVRGFSCSRGALTSRNPGCRHRRQRPALLLLHQPGGPRTTSQTTLSCHLQSAGSMHGAAADAMVCARAWRRAISADGPSQKSDHSVLPHIPMRLPQLPCDSKS